LHISPTTWSFHFISFGADSKILILYGLKTPIVTEFGAITTFGSKKQDIRRSYKICSPSLQKGSDNSALESYSLMHRLKLAVNMGGGACKTHSTFLGLSPPPLPNTYSK
jgi:hypothetical protein